MDEYTLSNTIKVISPQTEGTCCHFTCWAPLHKKVELAILHPLGKTFPMTKDDKGYWTTRVDKVSTGARYNYILDGLKEIPDPASLSQPEGINGPSEVIDLREFRWNDSLWKNHPLKKMIFYELHTGTFSDEGNFDGITHRLEYLYDLGINAIELMPVSQFPGKRNWGYDVAFPFAVQDSYGGCHGLMKLVNACHNMGIAVILDVVYNHSGPEGNYLEEYGPYFTDRYKTPWGKTFNFDDCFSYGVRNYVIQNALMWLKDYHLDGLRLDAVNAIYDFSSIHILQELAEQVAELDKQTGKKHYLIAESDLNDSRYINAIKKGGLGLDAQWNDDFHHSIHALVTGETMGYYIDYTNPGIVAKTLKNGFAYDGQYSVFRKRHFGNSSLSIPAYQFVVFLQNHDQTGNRKSGERLSKLVSFEMLKLIAGALFISPFLPMLFMGEEYGETNPFLYFTDHSNKKLNRLVREGRTNEFRAFYPGDNTPAPDPSDYNTYIQSKLSPDPLSDNDSNVLFNYYKNLIRLRKKNPVLRNPDKDSMKVERSGKVFTIERWKKEKRIIAFLNFGDQPEKINFPVIWKEKAVLLINSSEKKWKGPEHDTNSKLQPEESIFLNKESIIIYSV